MNVQKENRAYRTLEDLNASFQGWLERYGNRVHSDLNGLTPEGRWRKEEPRIDRTFTEQQIRQALMLRANRTVQSRRLENEVNVGGKEIVLLLDEVHALERLHNPGG